MRTDDALPGSNAWSTSRFCCKISLQGFSAIEIRFATDGETLVNVGKVSLGRVRSTLTAPWISGRARNVPCQLRCIAQAAQMR
jgi:hypothetical protein